MKLTDATIDQLFDLVAPRDELGLRAGRNSDDCLRAARRILGTAPRVAHIVIVTPGRCGLYETTRELVAAECQLGIEAAMVDPAPTKYHPKTDSDRGAPIRGIEFAQTADILVNHSGMDVPGLKELDKPIIDFAHGRPLASFLGERSGKAPVYSYHYRRDADPRVQSIVTYWPEHVEYHGLMFPHKSIDVIPPSVDLERWNPAGKVHDFGPHSGTPNVVIAEAWRDDIVPFDTLHAFIHFAHVYAPKAKLHLYGIDNRKGLDPILLRLKERGWLGETQGWIEHLPSVYRAADLVISPQRIYTRSLREAMACGVQVVSGRDCPPYDLTSFAKHMHEATRHPKLIREFAERSFNPRETAKAFVSILERVLGRSI